MTFRGKKLKKSFEKKSQKTQQQSFPNLFHFFPAQTRGDGINENKTEELKLKRIRCGLIADKKFVENVKEEETETETERDDVNVDQSLISLRPTDLI